MTGLNPDAPEVLHTASTVRQLEYEYMRQIESLTAQLTEAKEEIERLRKSCIPLTDETKDQFIHALLHTAAKREEVLEAKLARYEESLNRIATNEEYDAGIWAARIASETLGEIYGEVYPTL